MQTDATFLANNSRHCWMLHVASVCALCCMLLLVVGGCCAKFEIAQTFRQVQTDATNPNIGANNIGSCRVRLQVALVQRLSFRLQLNRKCNSCSTSFKVAEEANSKIFWSFGTVCLPRKCTSASYNDALDQRISHFT